MSRIPVNGTSGGRHIVLSCNTAWNIHNFRRGLIRALLEGGDRVTVVTPRDAYVDQLRALGCDYVELPMDNKGTDPLRDGLLLLRYLRLYRRLKPDAVLHFTIKPVIYGGMTARMLGIPYVSNITGLGTAFLRQDWLTKLVQQLYRISQGRAQRIFFQNSDDAELFHGRHLVPAACSRVLPGSGIDLERFTLRPMPTDRERPVFLLVARLLWDKGVGEFVEAARIVHRKYPQVRFRLLGFLGVDNATAIDRSTVEQWQRQGVVEYLGSSDDVRPAIEQATCVVLPSYREGTPRSLLEAAAMGRPIIATDVPGCRETVDHGVNGLLCRVRSGEDLAERMLQLLAMDSDALRAMGLAGRRLAETRFDERIVIDAYLEALNSLA